MASDRRYSAARLPSGGVAPTLGLLQQPRFVRLAVAKLCELLGHHALIYGLFILVISERNSALATSAFVLVSVVPSVLLSLPAGVVADLLPKKVTIVATMLLRVVVVWAFLAFDPGFALLMVLTLAAWGVYQFFSPAENAALPAVVAPPQITAASSLLNAVGLIAQLGGAGFIAPVAVKLLDANGLFAIVFLLYVTSLLLYVSLSELTVVRRQTRQHLGWLGTLADGLRIIRGSVGLLRVTTLQVLLNAAVLIVIVAAPTFIDDVLHTAPENAIYIFAPGAIGVLFGLIIAPVSVRFVPARAVVTLGFVLFAGVVLALPFVTELGSVFNGTFPPLTWLEDGLGVRRSIAATVLLIPFGGFGITLVRVATRTVVYSESPPDGLAQVFATQAALGSLVSLLPTLVAGALIDLVGVRIVLMLTGVAVAVGAVIVVAGPAPRLFRRGAAS